MEVSGCKVFNSRLYGGLARPETGRGSRLQHVLLMPAAAILCLMLTCFGLLCRTHLAAFDLRTVLYRLMLLVLASRHQVSQSAAST